MFQSFKSFNTTYEQFLPGAPVTPPPGCVADPHKYKFYMGDL